MALETPLFGSGSLLESTTPKPRQGGSNRIAPRFADVNERNFAGTVVLGESYSYGRRRRRGLGLLCAWKDYQGWSFLLGMRSHTIRHDSRSLSVKGSIDGVMKDQLKTQSSHKGPKRNRLEVPFACGRSHRALNVVIVVALSDWHGFVVLTVFVCCLFLLYLLLLYSK